jgi:hypothetical protein
MSHQTLVEIATAAATNRPIEPLLPRHISSNRRTGVTKAIARGLEVSRDDLPEILTPTGRRPTEAERRRFVELQKKRDAHATQLEIDPTLIASRATLSDLAHNWEKHAPELMEWQRDLLSDQLP